MRLNATSALKGTRSSQSTVRDPQIFEELPVLYVDTENSGTTKIIIIKNYILFIFMFIDWNKRNQVVNKLTQIAMDHPKNICKPKHSQKFLDAFKKLIQDNNFKVQLNALKNFQSLIPHIKVKIFIIKNKIKINIFLKLQ